MKRRLVPVVAVAGVLLPLVPARAHHGEQGARAIDGACPAELVPESGFTDVEGYSEGHRAAIDCILAYSVTGGTGGGAYSPANSVSRGQMASFLMRALDAVDGYAPPEGPPDAFPDDTASVHHDAINAAATERIAGGYPDGFYRAGSAVSRGQMATFVRGMLERAGASLPQDAPDAFADDDGTAHEPSIDILAHVHVVVGDAGGAYGPGLPVTRAQVALFLARSLDYLVAEGRLSPPFDPAAPRDVVVTATSNTTARVSWLAPASGTPASYVVYRATVANGGACPSAGYAEIATSPAPADGALVVQDGGLTAGATYCYRVSAIEPDGVESELSLLTERSRVTMPEGPSIESAIVDTVAETVTLTYSEDVECASASAVQFEFGGAFPMTPSGAACVDDQAVLTFSNVFGAGDMTYRQGVEDPTARVVSASSGTPATSPQTVSVSDSPPLMDQVAADIAAHTVRVTYSEPVRCEPGSRTQFSFEPDGAAPVVPTGISGCPSALTRDVILTFDAGAVSAAGALSYASASNASFWITDEGGNGALNQVLVDAPPDMASALADQGANQVVITYTEIVNCSNTSTTAEQFVFEGISATATATAIAGCGTARLTLSFAEVAGPGVVLYTANANGLTDEAGQPAVSQSNVNADARPEIQSAVADADSDAITLTYSKAVMCASLARNRFSHSIEGEPFDAICDGTTMVVLRYDDVSGDGSGSLTYTTTGSEPAVEDLAGNDAIAQAGLAVERAS